MEIFGSSFSMRKMRLMSRMAVRGITKTSSRVTTPVVALTADAFEDDRRACLAAGMDDFLVKPLTPDTLRSALVRWTGPAGPVKVTP